MKRPHKHLTIGVLAAGIALFAGSAIVSGAGSADDGTVLVPTVPVRILDTRLTNSPVFTLGQNETATVSFASAVPVGTRAVNINVTTTLGSAPSFLAVYPSGVERPIVSAVNWNGPTSQANAIAVKLSADYKIDIYNAFGTVDVVIDMMGYYIDAPSGSGPAGPVGPTGPAGATGAKGDTGATGAIGPQGIPGLDGADGADGIDGTNGIDGSTGPQGETGPAGAPGAQGPQGLPGNDGTNGTNGIDGIDGSTGPQGETGPAGPVGPAGPTGETGPAGPAGGPVGPAGPAGPAGVSGHELVMGTPSADNELAKVVTATCPSGKSVFGGGFATSDVSNPAEIVITGNYPSSTTVWTATATVDNGGGGGSDESYRLTAYVICATATV